RARAVAFEPLACAALERAELQRAMSRDASVAFEPLACAALERAELQRAMSRDASVLREAAGLNRLADRLSRAPVRPVAGRRDFEDVALTVTARAVTAAALARTESRGCHHRAEFPDPAPDQARSSVLRLADDRCSVLVEALAAVG
ncbi:L-aspartate oxidase, partial [Mycobacterium palustre]|nr:L-aspartate oxidase [Mycobacterium palustre]